MTLNFIGRYALPILAGISFLAMFAISLGSN